MSSTEEIAVVRQTANFPTVDLKDYVIAENTIHYIQVNHVIEKIKNAEAEENIKKEDFNIMVVLKTLNHKTSIDPKRLFLKIYLRNKKTRPRRFFSVFSEHT